MNLSTLAALDPAAIDLGRPLPREIIGTRHPWFTRYKIYPVFSLRWIALRFITWSAVLTVPILIFIADGTTKAEALYIYLEFAFILLTGPLLGHLVRRQQLSPKRELLALNVAVLAGVAAYLLAAWLLGEHFAQLLSRALHSSVTTSPIDLRGDGAFALWLGGGLGLFGYQRERIELASLYKTRELEWLASTQRIAEMRLAVLAAQVEPHFLFNTLAGIRGAITGDPARASAMLDSLAEYLRLTIPRLRSGHVTGTTLREQFDIIQGYLRLNSLRLTRLQYSLDLPPALERAAFPSLILLSLVENAVVHGIEPRKDTGHVRLSAKQSGQSLEVTVEDDGAGFRAAHAGSGLGLTNIRDRLKELFGEEAKLQLSSNPNGGVTAAVVVPLSMM